MVVDRIITSLLVVFGLAFIVWIVPMQVETVDFGRIVPSTVPTIGLFVLIAAGCVQLFSTKSVIEMNPVLILRASGFVVLLVFSAFMMERFGFEFVAPVLAFTLMLLIGERRWYWLLFGGIVVPIGVWLLVERALDRALA